MHDAADRVELDDIAERIDPDEPGKTLIFCVSEDHAQVVVHELPKAYAELGRPVSDGTIKVITGYTDDAQGMLRRYKNEKKPSIAITVDYLTTGVDVPEIVNLVFLRREALTELRQTLAQEGYRANTLQKAWAQRTNQDIAASIIGFIRQAALGEPLVPYEQRVEQALHAIYERHQWEAEQQKWLERIAKNLIKDQNVADPHNLDEAPAFKRYGGFDRINESYFDGQLHDVLAELNDEVWSFDEGA